MSGPSEPNAPGLAGGLRRFFTGAGFPVSLLAAVVLYESFLLAVVFAPAGSGPWAAFAEEFRIWCFRYDPRTGGMEWAAVWVMLAEPPFVAALAAFLWRRALLEAGPALSFARHWRATALGLSAAFAVVVGLVAYGRPEAAPPLPPFPGERIRTQLTPPPFTLADQQGEAFSLREARGRVLIVTGIYTMCSTSCPEILRELGRLLAELPADDRARLQIVALSLNPEYDTSDLMLRMAEGYGFDHPQFRFLNGDPGPMRELLQRWQFSTVRDPETGVVDHANLFHLVDAQGRIAYRLTLDPRHGPWLREAVLALTAEARALEADAVAWR